MLYKSPFCGMYGFDGIIHPGYFTLKIEIFLFCNAILLKKALSLLRSSPELILDVREAALSTLPPIVVDLCDGFELSLFMLFASSFLSLFLSSLLKLFLRPAIAFLHVFDTNIIYHKPQKSQLNNNKLDKHGFMYILFAS